MIFNNHLFSRLELKLNKVHFLLLNILSLVIFIVGEELFGSNPAEIDLDLTDIQKNPILLFFLVVVLAPLYEEFVNRSYLNNKKYKHGPYVFSTWSVVLSITYDILGQRLNRRRSATHL